MKKVILVSVFVLLCKLGYLQSSQTGLGPLGHSALGGAGMYYVGWDATSTIPLQIRHDRFDQSVEVFTGGIQRLYVQNNVGPTAGFVGIGDAFTVPLQRLHVVGDINLETSIFTRNATNDGYRINNQTVLQVKNADNLFVGWNAGAAWDNFFAAAWNTFVGNNSGFANTFGHRNSFFWF